MRRSLCALITLSLLMTAPAFSAKGLKLNQIQILGSHNSYRPVPNATVQANMDTP